VKREPFGVICPFSVLSQPEQDRFLLAESTCGQASGIIDGERINND